MNALTEVMGNVYFCDFEGAERDHPRSDPARPAAARAVIVDINLLMAQINAASKEIVAAHVEIMHQAREQWRDLLALVYVIDDIAFQAEVTMRESPHLGVNEKRDLAQDATGAANELLALAREAVLHARNAARRLAEIGLRSGLIGQTAALWVQDRGARIED